MHVANVLTPYILKTSIEKFWHNLTNTLLRTDKHCGEVNIRHITSLVSI